MNQKFINIFSWLLASLLSIAILGLLPYDEGGLALRRLSQRIQSSAELSTLVAHNCEGLRPLTQNRFEQDLLKVFWTPVASIPEKTDPSKKSPKSSCTLRIIETHSSQLAMISLWNFSVEIQGAHKPISRNYSLQFPKPLSLFPIVLFIMHLIFSLGFGFLGISISLYLLAQNGMNLIQTVSSLGQVFRKAILVDLNFYGYLLLSLWFGLYLSHAKNGKRKRTTASRTEVMMNRSILGTLGLWNPHFYILIQKLLFPVAGSMKRLSHLFEGQLLVVTLSIFLLGLDMQSPSMVLSSIQVPRYISLAILVFFSFSRLPKTALPEIFIWQTRNLPKYLAFTIGIECLSFFFPPLANLPTLFKLSSGLILAELCQRGSFSPVIFWPNFRLCFSAILVSVLILNFTAERGLLDLVIELTDPRKHPTAVIPFAVVSGFLLGFLSGGFSASSFVFVSELVNHYPSGLVKAALFDGLALGLILSPFSLFNLLPAFLFQVSVEDLVKERFNQVLIPCVIGFIIYLIGTLNLVGILQPVSFIFFCLCALTFKLKRVNWDFGMFGTSVRNDPH